MNIAFFVSGLDSGGLENYLLRFLQYKHKSFSNIYVYCKSGRGGQLEPQFLELYNVQIIKKYIGYFDIKALKQLKQIIEQNEIDIICDFTGNFAGLILRTARKAGVKKRVSFYRGATDHFKRDPLRRLYNKWVNHLTFKNATDILSNSKAAFNYFYPNNWKTDNRFEVIYNGIDATKFTSEQYDLRSEFNIPSDAFVVGHTGRFNEAKNHKTILLVAERLIEENGDIYFIMCGNGVKINLETHIKKMNLQNRILVFENRNDIPKFLNTMDCYFFPSITEGQPNALIEAMVMGVPAVASDIEPIKESIPKEKHEFLLDPLDINGFIEIIRKIYLSKDFAQKLIYKEWAINNFNYTEKFEQFYQRLKLIRK
ncbi:Glycosyltransferase involved in cell wall bisynthesis [Porphyromonadaceae bacterium KHP3R9]|nr:Glycosyltransferase involved in cell wall bisynthesis [Porphyromonadaceae bacterium KHP3R9]